MEELEKLGQQINKGEKEIDKTIADKYAKIDGLLVLTEKNVLKNEDLISGFCYVLENNFDKLWENSGKEEKEKLKQILLKTSENVELNDENSMKIANLTIKIFKELEYNWQELIDYILSPIPSSHKGLLFLKVLSAWEDFVEKPRLEAIFRSIRQFISFDDPKLQLSIIITVNNMNPIPLLQQEPSFFEALWAAILNISKNLPSRISTCATVCAELYKAAPVLRDFESSYLSSIVEKSKTFEEMQLLLPFSHILNELDLTNLYANVVEYIDFMGGSILGGCDCFFSDCEIVSVSTETKTLSREICFVTTGCQVMDPPSCSDGSHHSVSFTIGLNGNLSFFGGLFTVPINVSISSNGASHKGQAFTCSKDMPHTPNGGEQTISWFAETKVVAQKTTYECGSVAYSVISEVSGVRKTITKTTQCE